MGAKDAAMLAAILGSQAIGSLMAPDGQELNSFAGNDSVDPHRLLTEALDQTRNLSSVIGTQLHSPISLETRVPTLPSFTGGGLPMMIGAPAQDQAYVNPRVAKQSLAGDEIPGRPPRGPGDPTPRPEQPPNPDGPVSGPLGTPTLTRRPLPGEAPTGGDAGAGGGDETSKALASAHLLLSSLTKARTA